MVEAPLLTPFGSVCQDHVNIFFMDLTNQGLVMDVFNVLCGSQPSFQKEAEQSLQVEFRSGTTGQHKGVLIDFLCAQVEFSPAANSVQRRAAFYGPSSEEGLPDVVTEENCTTVGDFTQVPVQKVRYGWSNIHICKVCVMTLYHTDFAPTLTFAALQTLNYTSIVLCQCLLHHRH